MIRLGFNGYAQTLFTLAQVYANCDNVYEDVGIRSESFPLLSLVRFDQLLRYANKRLVNYIESVHRKEQYETRINAIP